MMSASDEAERANHLLVGEDGESFTFNPATERIELPRETFPSPQLAPPPIAQEPLSNLTNLPIISPLLAPQQQRFSSSFTQAIFLRTPQYPRCLFHSR